MYKGSPTGLNFYGGFHRPELKRPPTESSWTQRLAVLLTQAGFPTRPEVRYPDGSKCKCDNVVTLPDGGQLWLENKGAWKQWWIDYGNPHIYRAYLFHPLLPGLNAKSHTAALDLEKLNGLMHKDASAIGFILLGSDKAEQPMDEDVSQFARLAGIDRSPWHADSDSWDDAYRPGHRVLVWYWQRGL